LADITDRRDLIDAADLIKQNTTLDCPSGLVSKRFGVGFISGAASKNEDRTGIANVLRDLLSTDHQGQKPPDRKEWPKTVVLGRAPYPTASQVVDKDKNPSPNLLSFGTFVTHELAKIANIIDKLCHAMISLHKCRRKMPWPR
jgi:hypothetical protein